MSFFNDAQRDGLLTGRYICSECGGLMEFEDEWEDTLVCPLTPRRKVHGGAKLTLGLLTLYICTLIFENTLK